ncbi:cytochrome P450 [Hyaloscypha variabilis F]|uniref:Cytochrome P450 n=1 Tax=Hyaloscypha variabilis (strain UAMH 11265 / GT02V1 / F) TaxID=1149755 RepID=A0A2J6R3M3_HYAVF|nr:cytochrome P450 [Hyaloscypha variabilis F]
MGLLSLLNESRAQIWESWGWLPFALLLATPVTIYVAYYVVYNLYFHPLSKFPGPWYAVISDLFSSHTIISGHGHQTLKALHEKYGEVVRVGPDELSFSSGSAWKDVYAQRKNGTIFTKDHKFYITDNDFRAPHIVNNINVEEHAQAKKVLSHAFSPKSLLEQEDIVLKYADMLMVAIREESAKGPLNLNDCYNWVTFDVLGELAFGEPFGSVSARQTDEWISTILQMVVFIAWDSALYKLHPIFSDFYSYFIPPSIRKATANHVFQSKAKILSRLEKGERRDGRKDFCSYIFELRKEMGLNEWHMAAYSNSMIIAGSETTATVMSALTYYLCRTPAVYDKLKQEVRSRYMSSDEITSLSATFPYLTAVIHEILRIFPPIPFGMPRIVPPGGDTVDGIFIPGGTTVSVHTWSSAHSAENFKDPDSFIPERWLDPENTDNRDASNPFLLGPRACIGQNMAWMEMRILIAKMVFLFDYELVDEKLDWERDSPAFILWQKPELWTKVTPRDVQ